MDNKRFNDIEKSHTFRHICELFELKQKSVLDIGCGQGQYLRHFGKGSLGITTAQEEVEFGVQNSLPIIFSNAEEMSNALVGKRFDAFWANNLFEHLLSPHSFLMKLKQFSAEESVLVLGVPVLPKILSLLKLNRFRGALASNHINFFNLRTLKLTVERTGWKVISIRPFIFKNSLLDKIIRPIAPHLYVVAKNDINFVYPAKKVGEWKDDEKYRDLLSITNQNVR